MTVTPESVIVGDVKVFYEIIQLAYSTLEEYRVMAGCGIDCALGDGLTLCRPGQTAEILMHDL